MRLLLAVLLLTCVACGQASPMTPTACALRHQGPILWSGVDTPAIHEALGEVHRVTGLTVQRAEPWNWLFAIDPNINAAARGKGQVNGCEYASIVTAFASQEISNRAGTVLHELGHGLGLCPPGADADCHTLEPHGIMNPNWSRTVWTGARFSEMEEALLRLAYQ